MPEPPNNEPRKHGFQPGNKCAVGHGAPSGDANGRGNLRHGLQAGKLPKRLQYIEKKINAFRRKLEDAVEQAKGEVSIVDAAAINSAAKWERHGMLALNWLRKEAETLSVGDRLKFSEAIAKASDNRDKNLRLLGLDVQQAPWIIDAAPTNGKHDDD